MATLDESARHGLPRSDFGVPEKRSFPMPDKNHARIALADAVIALKHGSIDDAEKARIDAKAHKILGS